MSNPDEHTGEEANMSSQIWQSQPLEAPRISLEYVRFQAEKLNADFRRQLYVAYTIVIFAALLMAFTMFWQSIQQSGAATFIVGLGKLLFLVATVYLVIQVHRRGKVLHFLQHGQTVEGLHVYRAELMRRRDFYLNSWRWSLWPIVPSLAVFLIGFMSVDHRPNKLLRFGFLAGLFIVGMLLSVWNGKLEGKRLQRELDALSTLDGRAGGAAADSENRS